MDKAIAENDIFANIEDPSDSHYRNTDWVNIRTVWYIIAELLNFLQCIVNIGANLFLIIIILKFKRLRTRTNYYLINIAITNTIYHAFVPISVVLLEITGLRFSSAYCSCFHVEESSLFTMYLFAAMLALDWYMVNFKKNFVQIHQRLYKLAIAVVYLIGTVRFLIFMVSDCLYGVRGMRNFLFATYSVSLIAALVVNVLRARKPVDSEVKKTRYALIAANIILLSWLPLFVYHLLESYAVNSVIIARILYSTFLFPKILAHLNTVFLLYVLGKVSRNFQMAFARAFRKKVRDYEQDDLDNESDDEDVVVEHVVDIDTKPLTVESGSDKIMIY